jgi:hypothetical protein
MRDLTARRVVDDMRDANLEAVLQSVPTAAASQVAGFLAVEHEDG